MLEAQTPKGPTPRRGPTAAEAIAAQTSKSPPKGKTPTAAEAIAAQTSKAPPKGKAPTATEAIAAQTSKAKPPPQTLLPWPLPWPPNPKASAPSSSAAPPPSVASTSALISQGDVQAVFASFMNYMHQLYDNMTVPELREEERELNQLNIAVKYTKT